MSKTFSFFLTLATVTGIFGFWIFQNTKRVQQDAMSSAAETSSRSVAVAPVPSEKNRAIVAQDLIAEKNIFAEIESEKRLLDERKENLDSLVSHYRMQLQQVRNDYPNLISANALEAENLADLLETERFQAGQLGRAAQLQIQEQYQVATTISRQVEPRIQPYLNSLQTLQKEIENVASSPYINPIEKEVRIQNLQNNLATTNDQLQILLNEVSENSAITQGRILQTKSEVERRQNQSLREQSEILESIFSLRDEIARLQAEERVTRQDLQSTSQKMQSSKKLYEEQLQKVQSIETQIR